MRLLIAMLAGFAMSGSARAETWCMRQVDSGARACVFSSGGECSRAARLAASGGICERQHAASPDRRRHDGRTPESDRW
jgi:hypothetical protein